MVSIVVGFFGMIGALLRYELSDIGLWQGTTFPIGTLLCNLIGCLVLGWFNQSIKRSEKIHTNIKIGISTGLIGSFTTFSTFSVETIELFQKHHVSLGILYILVSLIGGWCFVFLGDKLGQRKHREVSQ
ncbi:putative fluoride ion transporter CrcB 1 [Pullulanibacillus camelliae]|uniref:Fluoride-specific ion channel FluC n=1 Tax=Pullulanibacillus camelliae TaxID=1707096 RepID=A0A8J2YEZ3_9BACL|nr:fluoride efflux transporter CrcB [Pullulanibacillus camelliae]GGE39549.1 putative fluoride ion transporter CrcB 1 [Pullulanibacillus camelliae]